MRGVPAILGVLMSAAVAAGQTPGFWLVGFAPGTSSSLGFGLSADGSVASGSSGFGIGYTWTRENGRYDFGLEPGMPSATIPYALSSDGRIIAGQIYNDFVQDRAFRRVGSGPLENLGVLPGFVRSSARGISGDGGTVVGMCEAGQPSTFGQAFRWTQAGGMQGLGYVQTGSVYSKAAAISRDGTTIAQQLVTRQRCERGRGGDCRKRR